MKDLIKLDPRLKGVTNARSITESFVRIHWSEEEIKEATYDVVEKVKTYIDVDVLLDSCFEELDKISIEEALDNFRKSLINRVGTMKVISGSSCTLYVEDTVVKTNTGLSALLKSLKKQLKDFQKQEKELTMLEELKKKYDGCLSYQIAYGTPVGEVAATSSYSDTPKSKLE